MDIKEILTLAVGADGFKTYDKYFMTRCIYPENHKNGDSNPSLKISRKTGVFYCLGCHAKGSIEKFAAHFPHLNLNIEDMQFFMHLANAHEKSRGVRTYEQEPDWDNIRIDTEGNIQSVWDIPEAVEYIKRRGIPSEFLDHFEVKATRSALINGTRFLNRLLIPMFHNGNVVNVEGRDFSGVSKPKVLYPKRATTNLIMNMDEVTPGETLHIVEGLMDVAKLFPFTKNVRPLLGSSVKLFQQKQLRQHLSTGGNIVVWPDHDAAGQGILLQLEKAGIDYYVAPYDAQYKDPGECPPEEIERAIANPVRATAIYMSQHRVFEPSTGFHWTNF